MSNEVLTILEICLERIRRGETIEQCLADYPDYRIELEPILKTALALKAVPRASPSVSFRQASRARLISHIRAESAPANLRQIKQASARPGYGLIFKILVPVTLVALIAIIVWAALPSFSPTPVSAAEFTLSLLSGGADVSDGGSSIWESAADGQKLHTGSRIRAHPDSSAVLTFFDGSMTKLEPGAEVLVSRSEYVNQRSSLIILEQESGKTWSYVAAGGDEKPYFAISTAQGQAVVLETAVAQGTAFSAEVDVSGHTRFAVMEGAIQVMEGERQMLLAADMQVELGDMTALSTPLPVPPAEDELIISTGMTGIGSVKDPSGASTGVFPDGLAFNQITNSKSVLSAGEQQILVEEPPPGEYFLTVREVSRQTIPVNIQVKHNGSVIYQFAETLEVSSGKGWIIHLTLDRDHQTNLSGKIVSIQALTEDAPEKVVVPALAKERAVPLDIVMTKDDTSALEEGTSSTPEPATPNRTRESESSNGNAPDSTPGKTVQAETVPEHSPVPQLKPVPAITPDARPEDTDDSSASPRPAQTEPPVKEPAPPETVKPEATSPAPPRPTQTQDNKPAASETEKPKPSKTAAPVPQKR
jgi:hypothetical protein